MGHSRDEPLVYNNEMPMAPFGADDTYALLLSNEVTDVTLQLGTDKVPLQLMRSFRLEPGLTCLRLRSICHKLVTREWVRMVVLVYKLALVALTLMVWLARSMFLR